MTSDRHPLEPFVRDLASRAELTADDRTAILNLPHTIRILNPPAHLFRDGELRSLCAVLVSGLAYRYKMTGAGARQIVAVHIPGEALDLECLFLKEADHGLQVLTQAEVALIPLQAIRTLISEIPSVNHAIIASMLVTASISREWITNNGRRNARARIAHLLCEISIRIDTQLLGRRNGYILSMTQEQIADATGLTSIHVNRMLKSLKSDGLISGRGRYIEIPDWRALRDAGDFTNRYLHIPLEP